MTRNNVAYLRQQSELRSGWFFCLLFHTPCCVAGLNKKIQPLFLYFLLSYGMAVICILSRRKEFPVLDSELIEIANTSYG